jgi:hypothetical protein
MEVHFLCSLENNMTPWKPYLATADLLKGNIFTESPLGSLATASRQLASGFWDDPRFAS